MHSISVFGAILKSELEFYFAIKVFIALKVNLDHLGETFILVGEHHQMHIRSVCKFCSSFAFGNGVCFF